MWLPLSQTSRKVMFFVLSFFSSIKSENRRMEWGRILVQLGGGGREERGRRVNIVQKVYSWM
jgi:hypothetical protein